MTKPCFELRLREEGMFSVVNEVVQHLYLADINGYEFYIDWRYSCYLDPHYEGDPWNYYFEPCFNIPDLTKPKRRSPVHNLIEIFLNKPAIFLKKRAKRLPARNLIEIFLNRLATFLTEPAISLVRLAGWFPDGNLIAIFLNKLAIVLNKRMKRLPTGGSVLWAKDNIFTPRKVDGYTYKLLRHDRSVPNKIIKKHLRLKPEVIKIIDEFVKTRFSEVTIGLHLRGVGHNGELPVVKDRNSNSVNYERFFRPINAALLKYPDAKILACSDSQDVIDHIIEVYGERTITYESTRSAFGEMHNLKHSQQKNKGLTFSPYKLGLDIIVEAYLLARTNYFVHGYSNVANFVLSLNDRSDSFYVYEDVDHTKQGSCPPPPDKGDLGGLFFEASRRTPPAPLIRGVSVHSF